MKTVWCHDCKHFRWKEILRTEVCKLGHKPRFYQPQTLHQAHVGLYGWKKKCEDFKEEK